MSLHATDGEPVHQQQMKVFHAEGQSRRMVRPIACCSVLPQLKYSTVSILHMFQQLEEMCVNRGPRKQS